MKLSLVFFITILISLNSCGTYSKNVLVLENDKFDLSLDLPLDWKMIDGDNDDFCFYGYCKKDSMSNDYFNVYYSGADDLKKGDLSIYNILVESPILIKFNEKLISSKIKIVNNKHYYIQVSTMESKTLKRPYIYVQCKTIIYDGVEVVLNYFIEKTNEKEIDGVVNVIENSIESIKLINIKPNELLHHSSC